MYGVAPPKSSDSGGGATSQDAFIRTYQAWKGSNKFILQGRFIFGPDVRSLFMTIFLIVAPVAVFCVFVARKMVDDFAGDWGWSIMVVAVVFSVYICNNWSFLSLIFYCVGHTLVLRWYWLFISFL